MGTTAKPEVPRLTDTQCRAARPHETPYKLPDGSGLLLEVKPNGVKAWRYRFKLNVQGVTVSAGQARSLNRRRGRWAKLALLGRLLITMTVTRAEARGTTSTMPK